MALGKPFASLCPAPWGSVTIMAVTAIAAVSSVWEARAPSQAHRSSGHRLTRLSPTGGPAPARPLPVTDVCLRSRMHLNTSVSRTGFRAWMEQMLWGLHEKRGPLPHGKINLKSVGPAETAQELFAYTHGC